MNLVIDIGNSSAKIGCFYIDSSRNTYSRVSHEELYNEVKKSGPAYILISSVVGNAETWASELAGLAERIWIVDYRLPLPFVNHYQTPQTLGSDRIAGVAGAQALYPQQSCLVIDAGTCIKYDWLENGKEYWGGSISPGLHMRFQAMHTFTSKLPLLEPADDAILTGTTTYEAMQSGVLNGMCAEVEGIITRYYERSPDMKVIICGGDAHFFERQLKTPIFAVSELVLIGLNHILNFTISMFKKL